MDEQHLARHDLRGTPAAAHGPRLPDARLQDRGRRRGAGGVDPLQPLGHERRREPRRLAHDRRLAGLPKRPPVAPHAIDRSPRRRPRRHGPGRDELDPESEALLADSVGLALLIVLDSLTPTERVAFVLHDMFAVPFEEIAPIVGRNATATRQLASRARRRVQHADADHGPDRLRQSRLVDAFLAAARRGDFSALVELLDPDAVLRCDAAAVALGGPKEAHGAEAVAAFSRQARGVQPALIDGAPAAAWLPAVSCASHCCSRSPPTGSPRSKPSRSPSASQRSTSSS